MRHKLGYRKLNKTPEHRKALFKNMLNSLIKYEQIFTTLPKAKELKPQIDKVITIGKKSDLHNKKNLFCFCLPFGIGRSGIKNHPHGGYI